MTNSKPLIVFGIGTASALAARAISEDTGRTIRAFTVDAAARDSAYCEGAPVVSFNQLATTFEQNAFDVILPLGFRRINYLRREKLEEAKSYGFGIGNWVSSSAIVPRGFEPRANVLIYEGAIVQHFAEIGLNVILRAGVNVGHHSRIGDHCFLASGVVTGGRVTVMEHCWLGLGAVIRDGVTLAPRTFVGAGAVVLEDTEPDGVYVGVPARRMQNKTSMELTA